MLEVSPAVIGRRNGAPSPSPKGMHAGPLIKMTTTHKQMSTPPPSVHLTDIHSHIAKNSTGLLFVIALDVKGS